MAERQHFEIYGRFTVKGENFIEVWQGQARSLPIAMRKAIREFWKRDTLKWKHVQFAMISAVMKSPIHHTVEFQPIRRRRPHGKPTRRRP